MEVSRTIFFITKKPKLPVQFNIWRKGLKINSGENKIKQKINVKKLIKTIKKNYKNKKNIIKIKKKHKIKKHKTKIIKIKKQKIFTIIFTEITAETYDAACKNVLRGFFSPTHGDF